jgi:hypothetical protein
MAMPTLRRLKLIAEGNTLDDTTDGPVVENDIYNAKTSIGQNVWESLESSKQFENDAASTIKANPDSKTGVYKHAPQWRTGSTSHQIRIWIHLLWDAECSAVRGN